MAFKFEKLRVWQGALDYADTAYELASALPSFEKYNLNSQLRRAATSVALNIAEGSTGQTDAEQARFLGMALRSLIETVACLHLIRRRDYATADDLNAAYKEAETLATQLQTMRRRLDPSRSWVREEAAGWEDNFDEGDANQE